MLCRHREYIEWAAAHCVEVSTLFRSPGFVYDFIAVDSMHAGDLGVWADALGSLFWVEITNRAWHVTQGAGIHWLNQRLRAYYAGNPSFTRVTL